MTGLDRVVSEVERVKTIHPPICSLHQAVGIILEEYREFEREAFERSPNRFRLVVELTHLAAVCVRSMDDLPLSGEE